jgi:hypothetical protein
LLVPPASNAAAESGAVTAASSAPDVEVADSTSPVSSSVVKKKKKKPTLDSFYDDDSDDGSAAFANVRSSAPSRENAAAATTTSVFLGGGSNIRTGAVKGSFHSVDTVIDEDLRCAAPELQFTLFCKHRMFNSCSFELPGCCSSAWSRFSVLVTAPLFYRLSRYSICLLQHVTLLGP